jgi:hypothetical protein
MTETPAADQIPPGGEPLTDFTWEPWTPPKVASRLAGVDVPWAFAAGWALELFLKEKGGVGSREHEAEAIRRTNDGLPYLAPEIVLLFKARWSRPKDEDDLNRVLPLLDAPARRWLRQALERVHPGHAWIARVE